MNVKKDIFLITKICIFFFLRKINLCFNFFLIKALCISNNRLYVPPSSVPLMCNIFIVFQF